MARVCVIGCGVSGIVAIKELSDEGHHVECFESASDLGGVFSAPGSDSRRVYDRLRLTISSHYMAFSDHMPTDCVTTKFWTGAEYLEYLSSYTERFDLLSKVTFNARVVAVERVKSAEWQITVQVDGRSVQRTYDAVAVCTGAHQAAKGIDFSIADKFAGEITHSSTYMESSPYIGKRVLVVGIGETAADVVREVSKVAEECHLLIRSPPFCVPRVVANTGVPVDSGTSRIRYVQKEDSVCIWIIALVYILVFSVLDALGLYKYDWNVYAVPGKDCMGQERGKFMDFETPFDPAIVRQMESFNKQGNITYLNKFATKNVSWLASVVNGKTQLHHGLLSKYEEHGVILDNGAHLQVDVVIYCTGYVDTFPFIVNQEYRPKGDNVRNLFRHAFSAEAGHTLCYIGFVRPTSGAIPACSELTARVFAQLLSKKTQLPKNIRQLIEDEKAAEEAMFRNSLSVQTVVNPTQWMDSMAQMIGAYVHPLSLCHRPVDFLKWLICTSLPARYRLVGPHASPKSGKLWLKRAVAQFPLRFYIAFAAYKVLECFGAVSGDSLEDARKWTGMDVSLLHFL